MSLVDRWLSQRLPAIDTATYATVATTSSAASISAAAAVACSLRHPATLEPSAADAPIESHAVATNLRHEKAQNSATGKSISQMSQMSQGSASEVWGQAEEERAAIVEQEGRILREWAEG